MGTARSSQEINPDPASRAFQNEQKHSTHSERYGPRPCRHAEDVVRTDEMVIASGHQPRTESEAEKQPRQVTKWRPEKNERDQRDSVDRCDCLSDLLHC